MSITNDMKRPPEPGEMSLTHRTVESGDSQTFAISPDNYSPSVIVQMEEMLGGQSLAGFRIKRQRLGPTALTFIVMREDNTQLSENTVSFDDNHIDLLTSIVGHMSEEEASTIADLEQCVAVMLVLR